MKFAPVKKIKRDEALQHLRIHGIECGKFDVNDKRDKWRNRDESADFESIWIEDGADVKLVAKILKQVEES